MSRRAPHRKHMSLFRAKKRGSAVPGARRQVQACARVDRRRECRWSRRASARQYADKDHLSSAHPRASGDPENETWAMDSRHGGNVRANGTAQIGHAQSFGRLPTDLVCCARQPSSRLAVLMSDSASTAAASSAALIAPALPMARVPTGMPPGICMIDRSESLPSKAWVFIGTPKTGRGVIDAVIPGRWAAPPAPAIITLNPFLRALLANSYSRLGVRCAETIRAS